MYPDAFAADSILFPKPEKQHHIVIGLFATARPAKNSADDYTQNCRRHGSRLKSL